MNCPHSNFRIIGTIAVAGTDDVAIHRLCRDCGYKWSDNDQSSAIEDQAPENSGLPKTGQDRAVDSGLDQGLELNEQQNWWNQQDQDEEYINEVTGLF